jgi:hypothetical protein
MTTVELLDLVREGGEEEEEAILVEMSISYI